MPRLYLIGVYNPKRNEVYEASLNHAAVMPFQNARMPSSLVIVLIEPIIPSEL